MTGFENLQVLVSVIIGLAVTNLLNGLGLALKHLNHTRFYWAHSLWGFALALYMVMFWWFTYTDFSTKETLNSLILLFLLLYSCAFYLPTHILVPETKNDLDLKDHYFSNRKTFFLLIAFLHLVDLGDVAIKEYLGYAAPSFKDWFSSSALVFWWIWTPSAICGSMYAAFTAREIYHKVFAIFYFSGVILWVWLLAPVRN